MARQSTPATKINPPVKCATCKASTYLLGQDFKPECCACLEQRLGATHIEPDIEIRNGRIFWTKV